MSREYISCADTAKLIRQAIKEAFPGVKFSVRSHVYSGGASITVEWLDGPNEQQVETVTNRFEASYFDGSIDFKGSIFHTLDGKPVGSGERGPITAQIQKLYFDLVGGRSPDPHGWREMA